MVVVDVVGIAADYATDFLALAGLRRKVDVFAVDFASSKTAAGSQDPYSPWAFVAVAYSEVASSDFEKDATAHAVLEPAYFEFAVVVVVAVCRLAEVENETLDFAVHCAVDRFGYFVTFA